jgi:hypothetical protein
VCVRQGRAMEDIVFVVTTMGSGSFVKNNFQ